MEVATPTTPNNTAQPVVLSDVKKRTEECFVYLLRCYHDADNHMDWEAMQYVFSYFRQMAEESNLAEYQLEGYWNRIEVKSESSRMQKNLLGWLLLYSGYWVDPTALFRRIQPSPEYNPWPNAPKFPPKVHALKPAPEGPVEMRPASAQPPPAPKPKPEPEKLDPVFFERNPDFFPDTVGSLEEQNFLLVENLVDGVYPLVTLLGGAFRYTKKSMEIVICCPTGEGYLGFQKYPDVVYRAGNISPELIEKHRLTEEQAWFLPLMQGVYRVHRDMRSRADERGKGTGGPHHRIYLVMRYYDIVLRKWNRMAKGGKAKLEITALNKAWRAVYGHSDRTEINLPYAIEDILDEGSRCNVITVLTTSGGLGYVADLGLSLSKLNSLCAIIPGDFHAKTKRGFAAIRAVLSDSRFQWVSQSAGGLTGAAVKSLLEDALKAAESHSMNTGDLIALISSDPPKIAVIERRCNGQDLKDYHSEPLTEGYQHYLPRPKHENLPQNKLPAGDIRGDRQPLDPAPGQGSDRW